MIKLAIFDFDNTLVNSDLVNFQADRILLAKYGATLTKKTYDRYHNWLYLPDRPIMDFYRHDFRINISTDELLLEKEKNKHLVTKKYQKAMEGAEELLSYLKKKNIICAIASNSENATIEEGLKNTHLYEYFSSIQCKTNSSHLKPSPDIYNLVLSQLGISAKETIAFDDSYEGIKAAQYAGTFCFAVPLLVADYNHFDGCGAILKSLSNAKNLLSYLL